MLKRCQRHSNTELKALDLSSSEELRENWGKNAPTMGFSVAERCVLVAIANHLGGHGQ